MTVQVDSILTELHTASQDATRKFFRIDDGGAHYWFVARDQEHVKEICRASGLELTKEDGDSAPIDNPDLDLEWKEIDLEGARAITTHDENNHTMPLADRKMGDWFCSDW